MQKNLSPEHSREVLKEMLYRVNPDEDVDKFDFGEKDWFIKYQWTKEEEDDFIKWLAKFLTKHKYTKFMTKERAIHEAEKIVGAYGWKIK